MDTFVFTLDVLPDLFDIPISKVPKISQKIHPSKLWTDRHNDMFHHSINNFTVTAKGNLQEYVQMPNSFFFLPEHTKC